MGAQNRSCHVYWCWCLRTHFSNIFSIFHVTCSFCIVPLSNATKLNHLRHLHLNTITSRWQCIFFFVLFFPMNLRPNSFGSQFACAFEYTYIEFKSIDFIATCNECSSISNTWFTVCCVCVCLCVWLRYDETRNLIIVVHLDSWKPNMKVKNAFLPQCITCIIVHFVRFLMEIYMYACSCAISV